MLRIGSPGGNTATNCHARRAPNTVALASLERTNDGDVADDLAPRTLRRRSFGASGRRFRGNATPRILIPFNLPGCTRTSVFWIVRQRLPLRWRGNKIEHYKVTSAIGRLVKSIATSGVDSARSA